MLPAVNQFQVIVVPPSVTDVQFLIRIRRYVWVNVPGHWTGTQHGTLWLYIFLWNTLTSYGHEVLNNRSIGIWFFFTNNVQEIMNKIAHQILLRWYDNLLLNSLLWPTSKMSSKLSVGVNLKLSTCLEQTCCSSHPVLLYQVIVGLCIDVTISISTGKNLHSSVNYHSGDIEFILLCWWFPLS